MIRTSGRLPGLSWVVAARPRPGERFSGDRHVVAPYGDGILLAVVDALGHGGEAARAAEAATSALEAGRRAPVEELIRRLHQSLRDTRGVAAAVAIIDLRLSQMSWMAVGNVEGLVVRADGPARPSPTVLQLWGILGYRLPGRLVGERVELRSRDRIVFATDGIHGEFMGALDRRKPMERQARDALEWYGLDSDDALVMVSEYRRPAP